MPSCQHVHWVIVDKGLRLRVRSLAVVFFEGGCIRIGLIAKTDYLIDNPEGKASDPQPHHWKAIFLAYVLGIRAWHVV